MTGSVKHWQIVWGIKQDWSVTYFKRSWLLGTNLLKAVDLPTFVIVIVFFAAPVIVVSVKTVINRPLSPTVSSSEGCTTLCVWGNLTYGKPSYHHLLVFPMDELNCKGYCTQCTLKTALCALHITVYLCICGWHL